MTNQIDQVRDVAITSNARNTDNYNYLLHKILAAKNGEFCRLDLFQINRILTNLPREEYFDQDTELKNGILRLLNEYQQLDVLKAYYHEYVDAFIECYKDECLEISKTENGPEYIRNIAKITEGKEPVKDIDPEANESGENRIKGIKPIKIILDDGKQGILPGWENPEQEDSVSRRFAFDNFASDAQAGKHQVIRFESKFSDGVGVKPSSAYCKRDPYAPGIEFVVGSLHRKFDQTNALPVRLYKLVGEGLDDGLVTYYQAGTTIDGKGFQWLLEEDYVDRINLDNFSNFFLSSSCSRGGDGKPDNIMARFVVNKAGDQEIHLLSVDNDVAFVKGKIRCNVDYNEYRLVSEVLNVLFFLPQMDKSIAPRTRKLLLKNLAPEKIIAEWLREVYDQNQQYSAMTKNGWTQQDLENLKLPIKLPLNTGQEIYLKLKKICELLEHRPYITHNEILQYFDPGISVFYQWVRKQTISQSIASLYASVATDRELQQQLRGNNREAQERAMRTISTSRMLNSEEYNARFSAEIDRVAEEFVAAIDCSNFSGSNRGILVILLENLPFIKDLKLLYTQPDLKTIISQLEFLQDELPRLKTQYGLPLGLISFQIPREIFEIVDANAIKKKFEQNNIFFMPHQA